MELDLVGCWDNFAFGEEFFEQGYAEVGDTDGLDLAYTKYYFTFGMDMIKQSNEGYLSQVASPLTSRYL